MNSIQSELTRADFFEDAKGIIRARLPWSPATDNRDLSGEERKRFDALDGEVRGLNARLSDAEKLAEFERLEARAEPINANGVARHSLDGYSSSMALTESCSGALTGLEAEWHQELGHDRAEVRGVMVPTQIILGGETRALTNAGIPRSSSRPVLSPPWSCSGYES